MLVFVFMDSLQNNFGLGRKCKKQKKKKNGLVDKHIHKKCKAFFDPQRNLVVLHNLDVGSFGYNDCYCHEASGTVEFGEFCLMMKSKVGNLKDAAFEESELRQAFKYLCLTYFTIREFLSGSQKRWTGGFVVWVLKRIYRKLLGTIANMPPDPMHLIVILFPARKKKKICTQGKSKFYFTNRHWKKKKIS